MLFGVETPKIDIPFSIVIAKACKSWNRDLFEIL